MNQGPDLEVVSQNPGVALVIGNFDGVHRGHQALVRYTLELAKLHGLQAKVMTFHPHPAKVLAGKAPETLTCLARKLTLLRRISEEIEVIVQPFSQPFSTLSPREFVERILVDLVQVRHVVVGTNFHFGRDRAGSFVDLQQFGAELGFVAHGFRLSGDEQGSISSSRIRQWISEGELSQASGLLGRPHAITGTVVHGDGRGASIGFATANLESVEEQVPPPGVYAGIAQLFPDDDASSRYPAAIHIGPRPTVERDATIEAHLLGYEGDLYAKPMQLHILQRLRGLTRFDNLEALTHQIALDVDQTRQLAERALRLEG